MRTSTPGSSTGMWRQGQTETYIIISGSGTLVTGGKVVNVGDIIIIPAGRPHGWADIPDHVDDLSVRPDPQRTISELYTNPALKKQ